MSSDQILAHLQRTLEGLAKHLFGPSIPMRWVGAYFPFTDPSLELEIWFEGEWMEVLGCGVIHPEILRNAGRVPPPSTAPDGGGDADAAVSGWAFGLGLERWAMILFGIPDIRLFWSQDERFLSQFKSGDIVPFRPYSKYPPVYKDLSFWLPQSRTPPAYGEKAPSVHRDIRGGSDSGTMSAWHANDMYEAIRAAGGDLIEQVQLLDEFVHPKTNRISHCYRITWRSMDRNLTNEEIDELQVQVRERVSEELGVELR
jgi:phenylalanyl-tRNA synthetase alpha chain